MVIVINQLTVGGVGGGELPIGGITMWYGLAANIPAGYVFCDGLNGTPDIRGKLVRGASNSTELLTTSGSMTHLHAGGTSSSNGLHSHTYGAWSVTGGTYYNIVSGTTVKQTYNHTHSSSGGTLSQAGEHVHSSSGVSGLASSMPPFKMVYWIRKVS